MTFPVRFGVGVSLNTTARTLTPEEMAHHRAMMREKEILVGFVMAQARVSQEEAQYLVESGAWTAAMAKLNLLALDRMRSAEKPVMLTEGTDG